MQTIPFVESYFEAWNDRDARGVASHLTADGLYCDIPDEQWHTRNGLVRALKAFFESNPMHYEPVGEVLAGRETLAFQYRVASADGAGKSFFGAEFITLDGGGAVRILDYYSLPGPNFQTGTRHQREPGGGMSKYKRSGLTERQAAKYMQRLDALMRSERVFLQPGLTLPALAEQVGCSVNHLSQVINAHFGTGYFDYLNRQRVEYAMRLLRRPAERCQSILDVALAAGFNSHSSFYAAFRKETGQTPGQYRLSLIQRA